MLKLLIKEIRKFVKNKGNMNVVKSNFVHQDDYLCINVYSEYEKYSYNIVINNHKGFCEFCMATWYITSACDRWPVLRSNLAYHNACKAFDGSTFRDLSKSVKASFELPPSLARKWAAEAKTDAFLGSI